MGHLRWNANLHAFDRLIDSIPDGARAGLDVGCGEGETARRLRSVVSRVVALDIDEASIAEARSYGDDIEYRLGDLLTVALPEGAFDVVSAVAVLHHLDQRTGLQKLAGLLRPGGRLLVVGLARSRSLGDFARDAFDAGAIRRHTLGQTVWETPSPKVWPPPLSYAATRSASLDVLPDAQFRRIPYFRYALIWTRPVA